MRALSIPVAVLGAWCCASPLLSHGMAAEGRTLPRSTHNLLVEAKTTSNLDSYRKGRRGGPDHPVYDTRRGRFVKESQWHEYGVGFGQDLGVVPEEKPAWWMAEWPRPVKANHIALSGVYPNQPQPETCWKIEVRSGGEWRTLERGKGGWYDSGRYTWGGPGLEPVSLDAFRVSVFSKDERTPLKSVHFRGEKGVSWAVALLLPIDAEVSVPSVPPRAGRPAEFIGIALAGDVKTWEWEFGDGAEARGRRVSHAYARPGEYDVALTFSDGRHSARITERVSVRPPVEARITPLEGPVLAGTEAEFSAEASVGKITTCEWDFGDSPRGERRTVRGSRARHVFGEAGVYKVKLTVSDGTYEDDCLAIVRAHTAETLHVPQVFLDTDQKNEQDDQYYFGYALFSELDILGVNSVHHGGGQEPVNYREILNVLDLAKRSGLPGHREPFVFRGANERLEVPASGRWEDTAPVVTAASEAIIAAARGASPSNPVWVVPVGPGTNVASAVLQARAGGPDIAWLERRLRVMWLGGSNHAVTGEFNGNNDPWSMYVVARSGLETWIVPAPVGARVRVDKRKEGDLYADHPLGQYLRRITPARDKPLFDPSCLSAVIALRLGLGWVRETEPVTVAGPEGGYRWTKTDGPSLRAAPVRVASGRPELDGRRAPVRVIRRIDQEAMKRDIFATMKGRPSRLLGARPPAPARPEDHGSRLFPPAQAAGPLHASLRNGLFSP